MCNLFMNMQPRTDTLYDAQDYSHIEKTILSVLKEEKVSLSQTRYIFERILNKIEDKNIINL